MKAYKKIMVGILLIVLVVASFFVGRRIAEQEYRRGMDQRCNTFISFAIDKIEKEGLTDQDTMEALISNIYAAYHSCTDPDLADQLHELWNTLIFREESYIGREDVLINHLKNVAEALRTDN